MEVVRKKKKCFTKSTLKGGGAMFLITENNCWLYILSEGDASRAVDSSSNGRES